jgi:hypothetical protein
MMVRKSKSHLSSHPTEPSTKIKAVIRDESEPRVQAERGFRYLEDRLERRLYAERERLLLDVANLRGQDGVSWFWRRWRWLWPETPSDLIELRDELQEVWRSDREFSDRAASGFRDFEVIGASPDTARPAPAAYFLNKWLSWRPSAEQEEARKSLQRNQVVAAIAEPDLRAICGEHVDALSEMYMSWSNVTAPFQCSLFSRRLIPEPHNLRAMLVQGVLEQWGRLKCCTNTHCQRRYFVAKRKDQTVCDAEICKAEKQREHARKWWNENRSKKAQVETKTDFKTSKKRSTGNVARKAR